jgi:hypothetical protein
VQIIIKARKNHLFETYLAASPSVETVRADLKEARGLISCNM